MALKHLLPLIVAPLVACMPRFARIDTGKPLVDRDLALAFAAAGNTDNEDFAEQLLFQVALEGGGSATVRLTVSNLASTDGRADLSVSVQLEDGRKVSFREGADRGEWVHAKDRLHVEVGDITVDLGVGRASVVARSDTHELALEVSSPLPPLRPQGGLLDAGGRFYVATAVIPRGAAELRLTGEHVPVPERKVPAGEPAVIEEKAGPTEEPAASAPEGAAPPASSEGEAPAVPEQGAPEGDEREGGADGEEVEEGEDAPPLEVELEGVAYVEHRAGNIPPYEVARRWYSLIDIGEVDTVVLSVFERAAPEGAPRDPQAPAGPAQGFFFAANDEAVTIYEPTLELDPRGWFNDDQTGYPLPELVFVSSPQGTFEGVVKLGALSERKDDLARFKKLERVIVRKFMKPWTFRFDRARYLFRRQEPGERMLDVRGEKRFQIQQLN